MAISVDVEMFDLSDEGIYEAAKVALQGVDLSSADWSVTGPLIERMGLSLRFDGSSPIGPSDKPWTASSEKAPLGERATNPHLAIAKAVVADAMNDERLPITAEQAVRWVQERHIFVDAIQKPSRHHSVADRGDNRFTVGAGPDQEDLEHFQNVVLLIEAVEGEFLHEEARLEDPGSGLVRSVTYVLL